MMKIMLEQWDKNEGLLKQKLSELKEFPESYHELVGLAFEAVYNTDLENASLYGRYKVDCSKITKIDNGEYQGTLIYLIPFKTYQPAEYEYLMTYVGYSGLKVGGFVPGKNIIAEWAALVKVSQKIYLCQFISGGLAMDESILLNVRAACDAGENTDSFDGQLIPLINTFLFRSAQAGVGKKGFFITGTSETWRDFIGDNADNYTAVKSYISIRVKLIFDPPESAALLTALKEEARELEWCLYDEADIYG